MTEYIEREAVLKIIDDNCPHDKGGYNTEEEMGAGAACCYIRKDVDNIPTADVVPKSEVVLDFTEEEIMRSLREADIEVSDKSICKIKTEVAREIFEEIEVEIKAALESNYKAKESVEMSDDLYHLVNGKISALRGIDDFVAELKKKYI